MQVKSIELHNIGIIKDLSLNIEKPLTIIFGDVKQGKTTIINSIQWALGKSFPADLLSHGEDEGYILITTNTGHIRKDFIRDENGVTKKKSSEFVHNGKVVKRQAEELKMIVNPFIMNREFLEHMNKRERSEYLLSILKVDTSEIYDAIKTFERQAKDLRIEIKSYGEIVPEEVVVPDKSDLLKCRKEMIEQHEKAQQEVIEQNEKILKVNTNISKVENEIHNLDQQIPEIEQQIAELQERLEKTKTTKANCIEWMKGKEKKQQLPMPVLNTADIDEELSNIKAMEIKYEIFIKERARLSDKKDKQVALSNIEATIREYRKTRQEQLASLATSCPVPGLGFDEDGNVVYENTSMDMLSTTQLQNLKTALQALYSGSIKIEFIDRGESLGTSIFEYIDHAKAHDLNILATVVGEQPAETPEEVGVFVIKNGELKN